VGESVLIPYDDAALSVIGALRYADFPRKLLRKGQRYTVQVFPHELAKLEAAGAIERIQGVYPALVASGDETFYSKDVGLVQAKGIGDSGMWIF
jgi:CRISPR-associated endonuclease/helicase Cas3